MNKQLISSKLAITAFLTIALSTVSLSVKALPTVVNGSFEVTNSTPLNAKFYDATAGLSGSGWTISNAAIYTFLEAPGGATLAFEPANQGSLYSGIGCPHPLVNPLLPPAGCFPATSPDKGNFVVSDAAAALNVMWQTLSGLIVGQSYNVTFWQAAGQQFGYPGTTTEQWRVSLGGTVVVGTVQLSDGTNLGNSSFVSGSEVHNSDLMTTPNGSFIDWNFQTLKFTVQDPNLNTGDTTSQILGFLSIGGPGGVPPFSLLDGVSIAAVPEPETLTLIAIGLLSLLFSRRKPQRA